MKIRIGDIIWVKNKNYVQPHFFEVGGLSRDFVVTFPTNEKVYHKEIIGVFRYTGGELLCVYIRPVRDETMKKTRKDLLKVSDLDKFSEWITTKGWKVVKPIGEYEVFRATSKKRKPILFYFPKSENGLKKHTKKGELFVTVMWQDFEIVEQFLKECSLL